MRVAVDEVLPGDLMRYQGTLREVLIVLPTVAQWAIRILFSYMPGRSRGLTVPLFEPVIVWRAGRDG